MKRRFSAKIVTANDLLEGDVIYMTENGSWSRNIQDARLINDKGEAERQLALASQQQETLVGAYLADADFGENGEVIPMHFRERFRATGPSNHFHGKQAEARS